MDACNDAAVSAHINGPTTITVGSKTCKVTEGTGTFDFALPNYMNFSTGIEYECGEPATEADKIISNESGLTLGFEGTKTKRTYPAALNPNKASKVYNVAAYSTIEGSQRAYDKNCAPQSNSVTHCTPVDFTATGSTEKGLIPAGATMYRELSTGKLAEDPTTFNTLPPVQDTSKEDGGCSVNGHRTNTRSDIALVFAALAAAGVMRRRKKD